MSSFDNAFTAALSGTVSNTVVYPLDVAKAQIQTSVSSNDDDDSEPTRQRPRDTETILQCLIRIYKEDGLQGLFRGYGFTMGSGIIQTFSYWLIYTMIRKRYYTLFYQKNVVSANKSGGKTIKKNVVKLSSIEELIINITSASVSNFITTPISIISTSQKTAPSQSLKQHILKIYKKNNNIWDFYKGLKISLILTCNPAITYTVFKEMQHLILLRSSKSSSSPSDYLTKHNFAIDDTTVRLSPRVNFACGMLSKIVATLVTFPLILSKVNLQNPNGKTTYNGVLDVLIHLYRKYGIRGWYKGLGIQLLKNVLNQGINSMVKGELGKLILQLRRIAKS